MRRVVITGFGGVTALGNDWESIKAGLLAHQNCVVRMPQWDEIDGLSAKLAAPVQNFTLPEHYTRKRVRSMGRVSLLSTRATELALEDAGLLENPVIKSGRTGIAFGSCTGSTNAVAAFGEMLTNKSTRKITATTYVQMMPHTTAVNTGLFFGVTGRVIPTPSACTSGSQAIGYAWEAIRHGYQDVMIAGGAEELCPSEVAVFDTLFAASVRNDEPKLTPRPFDKHRDGLVIGEGAGAVILESLEHAQARGAKIYAELVGFATNCDATHITQPNQATMKICMEEALRVAGLAPSDIGYLSAHGTATDRGDIAESNATAAVFGDRTPVSSMKSFFGHTLGACGAIESWLVVQMMREGWFSPTINLTDPDPNCGDLDYIMGTERQIDTEFVQSNNFAFGGINTSLIFKRWAD
ncbi:MAG: beta-ketoacyl-ACP synthase [Sutterella wadsworthensis]|nr:beta-ketoacyl-ACP synthase [Sutterella wadsworthensis]